MSWITKSNRLKHFIFAIPIGFFFTELCVLGVASGMEFKDVAYDKANSGRSILDWSWGALGLAGLAGYNAGRTCWSVTGPFIGVFNH